MSCKDKYWVLSHFYLEHYFWVHHIYENKAPIYLFSIKSNTEKSVSSDPNPTAPPPPLFDNMTPSYATHPVLKAKEYENSRVRK